MFRSTVRSREVRRPLALALVLALLAGPSVPQPPPCDLTPTDPPVENRDGYFVNLEEAPIRALALGSAGQTLWAINLPDARVVVYDLSNPLAPVAIDDIGVGLGPVAIRLRPGTVNREMWIACQSSNSVFIVDEATRRVKDSVRLVGEPTDIEFDATGQNAFVSLAAKHQIAKLSASQPHLPPLMIENQSEMPLGSGNNVHVDEPRNLLVAGSDLFSLSFQSGNGSVIGDLDLFDPPILDTWHIFGLGPPFDVLPPSDRDVLRWNATNPAVRGDAVLWRMGTLNFDLLQAPSGNLYVSTVDFVNFTAAIPPLAPPTLFEGEFQFPGGGFVSHEITYAAPSSGSPQTGTVRIDLNDPASHVALPDTFRCSVPTDLTLSPDGSRLFVACYETRNTAVIDLASDQVIADLQASATTPDGFGPRGVAIHGSGNATYVYNRGDQRLQVFNTAGLAPGDVRTPVATLPIGYDVSAPELIAGRRHFLNAANSQSGLATCNTCHMDGHLDGIAWDLSDATGNLPTQVVPREPKGTKVTMSLRGIEETPPFHWRGDRADLAAFNPAFSGLLGGQQLNKAQMAEFERFVFSLSYPANPNQNDDRSYSLAARQGFNCFASHPTHDLKKDEVGGVLTATCADCHSMAGGSGTLNQVNNPVPATVLADDATQLRGLWDKETDPVVYPNPILPPNFAVLPASGWGFGNTGFTDSIQGFVDLGVFSFPPGVKPKVREFLFEFDTGLAPCTAYAHTITNTTAPQEAVLTSQAGQNCDVIARGWVRQGGVPKKLGMLWAPDPVTGISRFETDTAGVGPFTLASLNAMTAAGDAVVTMIGTPLGSGKRLGVDRDFDGRRDGDEASAPATSVSNPDHDNDGFPDGYEIDWSSDPTIQASVPNESIPPVISQAAVAWKNSNVLRVRWKTDEMATSEVQVFRLPNPTATAGILVDQRVENRPKTQHTMVARNLKPGAPHLIVVRSIDPSGNRSVQVLPTEILQDHLFDSTHVVRTTLTKNGPGATPGTFNYTARFTVVDENNAAVPNAEVEFALIEWGSGGCTPPGTTVGCNVVNSFTGTASAIAGANGVATTSFDGSKNFTGFTSNTGTAEVFATLVRDPTSNRLYFKSLNGQFGFWGRTTVP